VTDPLDHYDEDAQLRALYGVIRTLGDGAAVAVYCARKGCRILRCLCQVKGHTWHLVDVVFQRGTYGFCTPVVCDLCGLLVHWKAHGPTLPPLEDR
jgi:hypothetical protein